MADLPYVFDGNAGNFPSLVLENSAKGPVLVYYWSAHAGPCRMLMPRLLRLAQEYRGRFLLALLNTDEQAVLVRAHGVNSIPTVKVYRNGRVVDAVYGAESETGLRRVIDRHVTLPVDTRHAEAVQAYRQGDPERAFALLEELAVSDPGNVRARIDYARLLILSGRYPRAEAVLAALPAAVREDPAVTALLTHAGFIQAADTAPAAAELEQSIAADPDNLEARYQSAALKLMDDDYEGALAQLLEILRRDRRFRDDAGRKGLLAVFATLGEDHELVRRYRALMQAALR